ncbi:MAG TPA: metallophosphoesterase [Burkholderiaceae bacterium]|nr:metallophosphoesterase [Burkholderiaceae bacterium]
MPARKKQGAAPAATAGDLASRVLTQPVFSEPQPTSDPSTFQVRHASDTAAYKAIDELNKEHKIKPLPFPPPRGGVEPRVTLAQAIGSNEKALLDQITRNGQIVFHSTGDCGSTKGPKTQNEVTDKMISDFEESHPGEVPQFNFLLGDIVYSFGERQYYYDQFYEPYRDYHAPVFAVAGNHDGMVSPLQHEKSLQAFLRNFCADRFCVSPDAGHLSRTAQIQPGVFFTFEAPYLRIIALYSNTLEDPGVIAEGNIGNSQLQFLRAALGRVKSERYSGALLFAHHHPPFVAQSKHGWSVDMQAQIDQICNEAGVWPHADLAGHAHNYQRFTRTRPDGTEIPYVVCGNGGHNVQRLTRSGQPAIRAPQVIQEASKGQDQIVLENYDDQNYGYLRVVASARQLRIEYHPAADGAHTKAPDDHVTVDLTKRKLAHFAARDTGMKQRIAEVRELKAKTEKNKRK